MSQFTRKTFATSLLVLIGASVLVACTSEDPVGGSGQSADPTVSDFPVAYIKRSMPLDEDDLPAIENINEPAVFYPGARVILKDRALPGAAERDISSRAFVDSNEPDAMPMYDVRDLSISPDGTAMVFAMRAPEIPNADELEQPTWNIWHYELETDTLKRVITSNIVAEDGDDIMPSFLTDGRIVFASSRQRQSKAILLDEGKPQFSGQEEDRDTHAFVLHVMEPDGTELRQITFNQSHDLYPTLLDDGRIAFLRWDNMGGADNYSLYTVHPDGQNVQRLYGYHSQQTGVNGERALFTKPNLLPSGRLLVLSKGQQSATFGGDPVSIDVKNFVEANQTVEGGTGEGQASIAADAVALDNTPSPSGLYHTVSPLWDDSGDRIIMSWAPCQLREPAVDPDNPDEQAIIYTCSPENLERFDNGELLVARPNYGIWIWNQNDNSQIPIAIPEPGEWLTDPVVFQERLNNPTFIPDGVPGIDLDLDLVTDNVGVLNIRSVYDTDGVDMTPSGIAAMADPLITPPDQRPARFLRLVKGVAMPDEDTYDFDNTAFGRSQQQLMREILGYVPIQPDGSVMAKVPANVPFAISVVDQYGRRVGGRHENWLQLQSGEVKSCNGCHTPTSEVSHGRADADPDSAYLGSIGIAPFPNSNPAIVAEDGETMAEALARFEGSQDILAGVPQPSLDVVFSDIWTDPNVATPAADINYSYADLETPAPISDACAVAWYAGCRITIHYEEHIQPIFDLERVQLDEMGNEIADNTCVSCHSLQDPNDSALVQVPAGQLELTSLPSPDEPLHMRGYRELFFPDNAVEVVEGAVVDQQVPVLINGDFLYQTIDAEGLVVFFLSADESFVLQPDPDTGLPTELTDSNGELIYQTDAAGVPIFETDENGNLVLDGNGNQIPLPITLPIGEPGQVTQPVPVQASLSPNGSQSSTPFFDLFRTGSHQGRLSDAELRLIAEWLDIGAQYFNNPFLAPEN